VAGTGQRERRADTNVRRRRDDRKLEADDERVVLAGLNRQTAGAAAAIEARRDREPGLIGNDERCDMWSPDLPISKSKSGGPTQTTFSGRDTTKGLASSTPSAAAPEPRFRFTPKGLNLTMDDSSMANHNAATRCAPTRRWRRSATVHSGRRPSDTLSRLDLQPAGPGHLRSVAEHDASVPPTSLALSRMGGRAASRPSGAP
jgi:hypothetical protein